MNIRDDGKIVFTDEEFSRLSSMLRGISYKYHGWSGLMAEDIEMELWVKSLEVIGEMGKIEMNLLARCAFNRALDMCRYAKKRNVEQCYEEDLLDIMSSLNDDIHYRRSTIDDYSEMYINELLTIFPKQSKEYTYVTLIATYVGVELNSIQCNCEFGEERMEKEVAHRLGYSDDTSQGYRKLKNKVRSRIIENKMN